MGVRHRSRPHCGLQFHPESVLTPSGKKLICNWIEDVIGMHPLIDGILAASRARGFAAAATWPKAERRDLISSARALKSRGIIPIIAEIKPKALGRALTPEEVAAYAQAYAENQACAISVLTEPTHFLGALENALIARRAGLPVLRKDFIFEERQLSEVQADHGAAHSSAWH